jgi:lipoyl(octanoyl) transferase
MKAKLNKKIDLEEVKKKILTHFKTLFEVEKSIAL